METTRVTASEFLQAFGALSEKARREPVVITKHGRDSLVVMSAEEWERLKRRDRASARRASLATNGSRPCAAPKCPTNSELRVYRRLHVLLVDLVGHSLSPRPHLLARRDR